MQRLALGCGLLLLLGCGAPAPRGDVQGTVRINGRPLSNVLVSFLPDSDRGAAGPRAAGMTDEQGRFQLKCDDQQPGMPTGAYRVTLEDMSIYSAPRTPDGMLLQKPPIRFSPVYGKVLSTTLLKRVEAGEQTIDLDLSP
jgi:hypothetical protein